MKQQNRLLAHLETHGSINPLEAWKQLGIYRLSAIVFILRNLGYSIKTNRINVDNQFGEKCSVANYIFEVQS